MGHNSAVSDHPKSTGIPQVDRLSTGPPDLGCHSENEQRIESQAHCDRKEQSPSIYERGIRLNVVNTYSNVT